MAKITVSSLALLAALSLPTAVIAQTSDEQQQTAPKVEENQAQPETGKGDAAPADTQAQDTQQQDTQQQAEQTATAKPPEGLIMLQDKDTFLASDLTGATVYSPADEAIGDVNDVIVSRDGKVDGIVVGVGGFLGIGEKDVAIEMSKIKMTETESGIKLVLDTTKDELAAAPEFKSKEDMQAETTTPDTGTTQGLMAPDQPAEGTDQPQQQQEQQQQ
jgi:ribosomal 30S subunit maturation factor RimM